MPEIQVLTKFNDKKYLNYPDQASVMASDIRSTKVS